MAETVGMKMLTQVSASRKSAVLCLYPTSDTYIQNIKTRWITYPAVRGASLKAGSWPIVVFSHGYWECGNGVMLILWSLAAEGAIVIAPDHAMTGNCSMLTGTGPFDVVNINQQLSNVFAPEVPNNIRAAIDLGQALFGNTRQVMLAGHSVGGWGIGYVNDPRPSASLFLSPSASNQISGEFATAKSPSVIMYGSTEAIVGASEETLVYNAVPLPAYQKLITNATHYECCDRTRCDGLASIAACRAADSRSEEIAAGAVNWLKAFGPQADATALTAIRAFTRVRE